MKLAGDEMKQLLICALAAVAISFAAACCGFSEAEAGQEEMFVEVYDGNGYHVVYHAETKVMYAAGDVDYGDVFTVLVNPDGTPMIWEE